jgi:outer membrane protein assembly factor BamB
MRPRLVPTVLNALLAFWPSAATAADNTGITLDRDQSTRSYAVVWRQPIGTDAGSLVVIRDQKKLLVGTNNGLPRSKKHQGDRGVLMCFSTEDGRFLWQATHPRLSWRGNDIPGTPIQSVPFVDRNRVYYVSNRGELICLDLDGFYDNENDGPFREEKSVEKTDADVVWSLDMVGKLGVFKRDAGDIGNPTSSPLVIGDHVYCVTGNGSLYGSSSTAGPRVPAPNAPSFLAARSETGQVAWTSNAPGDRIMYAQWSSPVAGVVDGKQQVIFAGGDGFVYGFGPNSGDLLWKLDCNLPGTSDWTAAKRGTKCFCVSAPTLIGDTLLVALSQDFEMSDLVHSPIVAIDMRRVQVEGRKAIRWTFADTGFQGTMGRVAVAGKLAFALDTRGVLVAVDAETGHVQWRRDLEDQPSFLSSPVVSDGRIFVARGETLFAFTADSAGRCVGRWSFDETVAGTPVFQNDLVYVTTRKHVMALRLR